ncbi:neuraminidase-like domain-containing protein [Pseudorhodoferax sp.]|uniref:Tc toxin subunit A-related protein n=1 Tax=Pseudorhodoferax sp. TaxID=1993553 RepID=UPI0039E4B80E
MYTHPSRRTAQASVHATAGGIGIQFTAPAPGAVVGRQLQASGRITPFNGVIHDVVLQCDGVALSPPVTLGGFQWSWSGALPAHVGAQQPVQLVVQVAGVLYGPPGPGGEPPEEIPASGSSSVTVRPEAEPPLLQVDGFTSPVTPAMLPYPFVLSGSASDGEGSTSGLVRVEVQLGDAEFVPAENPRGDWSSWRLPLQMPAGEHRFTVRAVDGFGSVATAQRYLVVQIPVELGEVEQVFERPAYLRALRDFARRCVAIDGGPGPDAQALAVRFLQPFDALTDPARYARAVAPVARTRIAVEVLRRRLAQAVPAALDQAFRADVYAALLHQFGTDAQALALARAGTHEERQALAARLGLALSGTRPDVLDALALDPASLDDAALEHLFGLQPIAAAEPLPAPPPVGALLLAQLDALRQDWQRRDTQERDGAAQPLPLLDPDLVAPGQLRQRGGDDQAQVLWTARAAWIAAELARIRAIGAGAAEGARFDLLVGECIGPLDFAALLQQDADGIDITPVLQPMALARPAFRLLAQCRATLDDGLPLQAAQWAEVHDIALQVAKRRLAAAWRSEERAAALVLEPERFQAEPDPAAPAADPAGPWRREAGEAAAWAATLQARQAQAVAVRQAFAAAVDFAQDRALPALRDALIAHWGAQQQPPLGAQAAATRLSHALAIDLRDGTTVRVSRVMQAIETLQGLLFSLRAGRLGPADGGAGWEIRADAGFDREWAWIGSYQTWLAAERVFAYPENQLLPTLYLPDAPHLAPSPAWTAHLARLRAQAALSPASARALAAEYLAALRSEPGVDLPGAVAAITDERDDQGLAALQALSTELVADRAAHAVPTWLWEVFWFVPMSIALQLQQAGQFLAALGWYRTVFAFDLAAGRRCIWHGLAREAAIDSRYDRVPEWLSDPDNPHAIARTRRNAYTRYTVQSIAGCLMRYADTEFARNQAEATVRARTLYETALALLSLPEAAPDPAAAQRHPPNPLWDAQVSRAQSSLDKIHAGLNLAGLPLVLLDDPSTQVLPSPYRFGALLERAQSHVAIAQQIESAYLSALVAADAAALTELQARQGMALARSTVVQHDLRVADAGLALAQAATGRDRAQALVDHAQAQLDREAGFGSFLRMVSKLHSIATAPTTGWSKLGGMAGLAADMLERRGALNYQLGLAHFDLRVGQLQVARAGQQQALARAERSQALLQVEHAEALADFLARKFTQAELFEWMGRVLGEVYAYFLQQATALAQLAQAQLAFERQERGLAFIGPDYWQSDAEGASAPADRRGLTGSARLLQDIARLDQFAFETDRRRLQLSQTLSLAQLAPLELQRLRETGVLAFHTPMRMFDAEFPGHHLRLVRRVRLSMVATVPAVRGVRATLSTPGLSRVVVERDGFASVTLARPAEAIAFTGTSQASGLFELEPDRGLLLPFEGMGVDAAWRLDLPKPANPFDYGQIADVLLTLDYSALDSRDYRRKVVAGLGRRVGGERLFSVRHQFPDAWYALHNAQAEPDPARRMRIDLPLRGEDFLFHAQARAVEQLSLVCVRRDGLREELEIAAVHHLAAGGSETVSSAAVRTVEGMASTRRPSGAGWRPFIGIDPAGDWRIALVDTPLLRSWFEQELVDDIVWVVGMSAQGPAWD